MRAKLAVTLGAALVAATFGAPAISLAQTTERVSVSSAQAEGDGDSERKAVSADGRFVAFESEATDLVPDDTNDERDIFVRDRQLGTTTRVNLGPLDIQSNGDSGDPAISADGRFVAWQSTADNLVAGDTNGYSDVFVHDRDTGTTELVSLSGGGQQGSDGGSFTPRLSEDGRYVVFETLATDLVPDDFNDERDILVRDRLLETTTRVSVSSTGDEGNGESDEPVISDDGQRVAFESDASNLVAGDTNGEQDVFVHDLGTGTTTRVSVDSAGLEGDDRSREADISADGRYVAFSSDADNLVPGDTNDSDDVFVHDLVDGTTERVSVSSTGVQGNGRRPSISADGRYVAFDADADTLVDGDANGERDVFRRDRLAGVTELLSVDSNGVQGNDTSGDASISDDGLVVGFDSEASNLVAGDIGDHTDVFVRILAAPYADQVLAKNPVGYWRFGEPSGTTALDSSGNDNHGTYFNGPLLEQAGAIVGDDDTAARFDGVNDEMRVPHAASLNVGSVFTAEGWVKRSATTQTHGLMNKGAGGLQLVVMNAANGNEVWLRKSGVTTIARSSVGVPADGSYHHVVATMDGAGTARIYINGVDVTVPVAGQAAQVVQNTTLPLRIAGAAGSTAATYDEFALYGAPLSAAQVLEHYAAGAPPLT